MGAPGKQGGARAQRAVCAICRGLTMKKWSGIPFRVCQLVDTNQNKETHSYSKFMALDKGMSFLVSRPKFLKGGASLDKQKKDSHLVTTSWCQILPKPVFSLDMEQQYSAKSWSKKMEWRCQDTQQGRESWDAVGKSGQKRASGSGWARQTRCSSPGWTHLRHCHSERSPETTHCVISNGVKYNSRKTVEQIYGPKIIPIHSHTLSKQNKGHGKEGI